MSEEPRLINDLTRYINEVIFVIEQGGCDEHGINFANFRLDGKRHISILFTRNVIWTFFWRPPPPPLEMSRTFFGSAEAPEALFILHA